jgi:TRAP-type mannitol/chloroaromatic compound transport system substrate-binding protein
MRKLLRLVALGVGLAVVPASAQEVVLRAVTSFAEGTQFSKNFERFIEKVNADGKGVVRINYIGGPRAMPPFEVGNAVRTKVVDIANVTGAFYTNLMPEADAFKLIAKPMSEQRRTAPGSSSINCTIRSSIRIIWRASSTTSRSTSISTRSPTSSTSPA